MGYRQLEQMFGVSQESVAHFTKRFIDGDPTYPRLFRFLSIAMNMFLAQVNK